MKNKFETYVGICFDGDNYWVLFRTWEEHFQLYKISKKGEFINKFSLPYEERGWVYLYEYTNLTFNDGFLYTNKIGKKYNSLVKINPNNGVIENEYKYPSNIHPNTITSYNDNFIITDGGENKIYEIKLIKE